MTIESYCDGRGFRAYWDGSAWAGEFCPGCTNCDPEGTKMRTLPSVPIKPLNDSRAALLDCREENCRMQFPENPDHWCRECLLDQVQLNRDYIRRAASMGDYDY